jgi:hypothetical protein
VPQMQSYRRRGRLRSTNFKRTTAEGSSTPANAKNAFAGDPGAVPPRAVIGPQAGVPVPHENQESQARASLPNQARTGLDRGPACGPEYFDFVVHRRRGSPFDKLRAGSAVHKVFNF